MIVIQTVSLHIPKLLVVFDFVVKKSSVCDRSDQILGVEGQGPLMFECHK